MSSPLAFLVVDRDERLSVAPQRLIVAGYTGRDRAAVQAHIDELAEQGIAPPPTVPMFYELFPSLLTADKDVTVSGSQTSGEVEPVYARVRGRWYLGVGSDHTDRLLEQRDVLQSKAACIKPVGTTWVTLPSDVLTGGFDGQFDEITATSWVDGSVYQQGSLSGLRPPSDVLSRLFETLGPDDDADLLVYGGTLPLLTGAFAFGTTWRLQLTLSGGATVEHEYTVSVSK